MSGNPVSSARVVFGWFLIPLAVLFLWQGFKRSGEPGHPPPRTTSAPGGNSVDSPAPQSGYQLRHPAKSDRPPLGRRDNPVRDALHAVIIPLVDFEDTTVEEAMDFLRARSIELDTTTLDPNRRGFSIVIAKARRSGGSDGAHDLGANGGLNNVAPEETRMSFRAESISAHDLLEEICRLTGFEWEIGEYAIKLRPKENGANPGE
ncbi:MAG: hypothetical protein HKN82_02470 [Akkermansiaceae bacterium]|nr:hypothetical protein [Akkermansiaceae bacterium]NNM29569.1 hypothetical protein [Akkermansiaceae bacterium]